MKRLLRALWKFVGWPFRLIRRLSRTVLALLVVSTLALNVATLTISGASVVANAVLSGMGLTTVAAREAGTVALERKAAREATEKAVREASAAALERKAAREAIEKASREVKERTAKEIARKTARDKIATETVDRVSRRVQRGAARNISSVAGESIPILGIAVIAGALSLEVKDACDTAADMAGLQAAMVADADPEIARQDAVKSFDCLAMIQEQLPTYEDLPTKEELWKMALESPAQAYNAARRAGIGIAEFDWSGSAGYLLTQAMAKLNWFAGDEAVSE